MWVGQAGLGERLEGLVEVVREREAVAGGNPVEVGAAKAVVTYVLLLLIGLGWREDGSHGLDYEPEERTGTEQWIAERVVTCLGYLLRLLRGRPVRDWGEVGALEECRALLAGEGEEDWEPEIIQLGEDWGVTLQRTVTSSGVASFGTPEGAVTAYVYKAREPEVTLDGVAVYLVRKLGAGALHLRTTVPAAGGQGAEYAVMVDDPYWGRRVQPGEFRAAPWSETVVMGYRVRGRILEEGEPVAGALVSLEGVTADRDGRETSFWDSLEYNELVWSESLETWVEGAVVTAPLVTDEEGRWSTLLPRGHGAIYQRAGDRVTDPLPPSGSPGGEEGAPVPPERHLKRLEMVHRGRRAELVEETEAVLDLRGGGLAISGEAGCWVKVGTLDEDGQAYLVPESGVVELGGLPEGEHGMVQFRRNRWGEWDPGYGCARQVAVVAPGATVAVEMGVMEGYDPTAGVIAGRVYERLGVPAGGVSIVTLNYETGEMGEPIASTDAGGYWEVEIPPEGLGGDPWIHDPAWGSVPLLGYPYSDVVLGARAYAAYQEEYKPEVWRKGDRGHSNFQYLPREVWVQDTVSEERFETVEAAYGGWVTEATLPKFRYVADTWELLLGGPQLREYSLHGGEELLQASFCLRSQPFAEYEDLPGQFRAAGYYPEFKFLYGGKISGSAVVGFEEPIGTELPEALRLGLEFGAHEAYLQVSQGLGDPAEMTASCWTDLVCPYCGGPAWRDPSGSGYRRGFCRQCADCFQQPEAMDCRTHFVSRGLAAGAERYHLEVTRFPRGAGTTVVEAGFHWRPDLYDEKDDYLTQTAPGQATNAPRWRARHVDEAGDGLGLGRFDSEATPAFTVGHDLAYFGALPEVNRELGLAQVKLSFGAGYVQAAEAEVELDCRRGDGEVETVAVVIPAGTRGATAEDPVGEVVPVTPVDKLDAEAVGPPYEGVGLYVGVDEVRLVRGSCQFTVVNDGPLLASAAGVEVRNRAATPSAVQVGGTWSGPHLADDGVGQVYLAYGKAGDIWLTRRAGLVGSWETAQPVTADGINQHPTVEKDQRGTLRLVWEKAGTVQVREVPG